jgi:GntR family transcriptional regulator of vanillate catabolism
MRTRSEQVAKDLRDRILRGLLPPGAHLQEVPLSEELGVSRTPVRAALAELASERLLDYRAKRGYTVRGFTLSDIETAHEVRANLEGLACRLAAERGLGPAEDAELRRILADGDAILARGRLVDDDREGWVEMNDRFHLRLIDFSGNRLLQDLIERTHHLPLASSRVVHWYDFQAVKGSHALHHRIYRYVRDRRSVNAEALMREHIFQGIDQIRRRLETTAVDADDAGAVVVALRGR